MTISNVISEIDVLVVSDPQFSLYLLQFGSKPLNFDFGSENIDTAKISRKKDQIELSMLYDMHNNNYDKMKGEAFSKNAMAKDLSHTSKYLEKKVFTTHSASSVNGNEEFIGVFKLGVLYLLPISHILELKPTLNYLDKSSSFAVSKNKDRDIFDANPDEEMDLNPDSEYNETIKTEVINVKFATQNIKTWELSQQKQNSATDSKSSGENVQTNDLGQHNSLTNTNLIPLDKMHFKSLDMIEAGYTNNNNANDKHTWIDLTYLGRDNRYIENLVTTSYSQSILPCQYQTLPHEGNDKLRNHSSNSKSESTMLDNGSEIKSKPILYMNTLLKPLMVTVPFPEKVDSSLEKIKTNNPNNSEIAQLLSRLLNKSTSLSSCLKPKQHNYINNNAHQILARSQKSVVDQPFCFTMIFELLQRAQILPFSIIWDHFLSRYLCADTNKTNNETGNNNINLSIREKLKLKRAIIEYLDTIATVCAGNWVIKSQYLYNSPVANNKDEIKLDSSVKDATQSNIITTNNKIDGNLANINTTALPKLCNLRNRNNLNSNHNNNTNSNNNRISRLETQKLLIEHLCLQARDFILYCFDVGETYHNMHFDNINHPTSLVGTTKSLNSKSLPFYLTRMDVKQYFPELPTTDLTKIFEGIAELKKLTPTIQGWCLKYGLDNETTTNLSHPNNNNNNNTFDYESNEIIDKNNLSFRMITLKHLLDVVKNHKNFKKFDITINNYYGNDNKNTDDNKINKQTWVKGVQKFLASANNPATNNNISHKYSLEKQIEEYNVLMQFIISTRTKKDYTSDTSNLNHNTNPKIKSPHTLSPTSPRRKRLKSITANINNGSSLNVIPLVPVVKTEFDIDDHVVVMVDNNKGKDNLPTLNLSNNTNTSDNDNTTNNQGLLSVAFPNDQKPDLTMLNKLLHANVDKTSINGANYSDYIIQSNTNMTINKAETCTVSQQTTVNTNDSANARTVGPTRRSTLKIKANIGKDMTKQRK